MSEKPKPEQGGDSKVWQWILGAVFSVLIVLLGNYFVQDRSNSTQAMLAISQSNQEILTALRAHDARISALQEEVAKLNAQVEALTTEVKKLELQNSQD
jgi:peptidoglycan hydrolase CwlO-like protein